jgi:hypothetical protein
VFLDDDEENRVEYANEYEDENTSSSAYNLRFRFVISTLSKISFKRGKDVSLFICLLT